MIASRPFLFAALAAAACGGDGPGQPGDLPPGGRSADRLGVINVLSAYTHLEAGPGGDPITFHAASNGAGASLPCVGDFDGDGFDSVGVFDYGDAVFLLQNDNRPDAAVQEVAFGTQGSLPVCGDFDGDGIDTIGVYDPATAEFQLRNDNSPGEPDVTIELALPSSSPLGSSPLAGDFDGDGTDTIGLFDPSTSTFELAGAGPDRSDLTVSFGDSDLAPVVGDFDGDGVDSIGTFDGLTGDVALRNDNSDGPADIEMVLPIVDRGVSGVPAIQVAIAGRWLDSGANAEQEGFDWPGGDAADEGIDVAALDAAIAKARALPRLHSLLVVRHGKLVAEEYFNGFSRGMSNNVQSVSKSVLSLLFGIAYDKGEYVPGTPVQDVLPQLGNDPAKQSILIEHLLTMSSGLAWSEVYPLSDWSKATDPLAYVWDQPVVAPPGEQFLYSTGGSYVAGTVLQALLGERIDRFARRELFARIGIDLHAWYRLDGVPHGGSAMFILPRDMARIGELVLRNGTLDGTEVVSSEWITGSTMPLLSTNNADSPYDKYGAKWWVLDIDGTRIISARGLGGQFIFIVPVLDAVVVTTSVWYTNGAAADESYTAALSLILLDVLPAITL